MVLRDPSQLPISGGRTKGAVAPKQPTSAKTTPPPPATPPASKGPVAPKNPPSSRGPIAPKAPTGGGGGYGGGLTTTPVGMVAESAPPPPPSLDQWRAGDSIFNSVAGQGGSIDTDLNALLASLTQQNTQFNQGIDDSMRNLGWDQQGSRWLGAADQGGMMGAFGQAQNNTMNDFSGRGLMDSSFFNDALTSLTDNFNRQRGDYDRSRANENSRFGQEQQGARSQADAARQQAMADAASRYASLYGQPA